MRTLRLATIVALLLASAPSAHAELERGEAAPPLQATRFLQGEAAELTALRGHAVLIEFFSTTCPHCQAHVAQLNRWHERFLARGLVVIGVTREPEEAVRAFLARHGPRYRLALVGTDAQRAYGVRRYPEACLVDAFGDVAWSGYAPRLPAGDLLAQIQRSLPPPDWPAAPAWLAALLTARRYAEVRNRLASRRECGVDRHADCLPLRRTLAWIDEYAAQRLAAADEWRLLGRPYAAWRALDEIARAYAEEPEGRRAATAQAQLRAEAARAREIDAGRALAAGLQRARHLPAAQAAAIYRRVSMAWPRTRAAAQAEAKAASLLRR